MCIEFYSVFRGSYLSFLGHLCWRMWEESMTALCVLCWCSSISSAVSPSFLQRWWALTLGLHNVTHSKPSGSGTEGSLIALVWWGQKAGMWFLPLWRRGLWWPGWNKPQRAFPITENCSALVSRDPVANGSFYPLMTINVPLKKTKDKIKCFRNRGLLKWL